MLGYEEVRIPFVGVTNARDIGGCRTGDGRQVRRGLLYRSADLNGLVADDHALMEALGIRTVLDLRSDRERARRPARLADGGAVRILSRSHVMAAADFGGLRARKGLCAGDVHAWMVGVYRAMPVEQAEGFRLLFQLVDEGALPLLFHCAAGKDRTGAAAALLLSALGVERAAIHHDFAMTDRDFLANRRRFAASGPDPDLLEPEWEPMLRVHPDYLDALMAQIEDWPGGIGGYCETMLGFASADLDRLRARLLEPA